MHSKSTRLGFWTAALATPLCAVTIGVLPLSARTTDTTAHAPSQASTPARLAADQAKPAPAQPAADAPAARQQPPAGQSSQTQQPPPAAPQQGTQKPPTFRLRVELVTQDVIPRDSRGQFIPDLKKDEFEVYEDGVLQDVISMDLVHGGRHQNLIAPPPVQSEEGILLPPSRPQTDTAGRIFVFFIDDLHIEFRNTGRLRDLLTKMQNTLIHDGDMFAIQTTGPSSVAVDLTYDKKRFAESVKKISGSELKPSEIINGPEGAEGPNEVRYRAHVAFSTVNDLLLTLDQVRNRRKALIYVSDGYDFNPFEQSRMGEDPNGIYEGRTGVNRSDTEADPWASQGKQFADADLVRELADLTRTANRANVTMYTIDPRGLVGGSDLDEQVDPTEWMDYLHKAQDSLRVLAEQTGGIAVINQNDYTKALQAIDAQTSDYYVLGYYSKNPDPTKRYRSIEVKIKRPNVTVIARKGYQLKRPPKSTVPGSGAGSGQSHSPELRMQN